MSHYTAVINSFPTEEMLERMDLAFDEAFMTKRQPRPKKALILEPEKKQKERQAVPCHPHTEAKFSPAQAYNDMNFADIVGKADKMLNEALERLCAHC